MRAYLIIMAESEAGNTGAVVVPGFLTPNGEA
jgi:hypothetical protein